MMLPECEPFTLTNNNNRINEYHQSTIAINSQDCLNVSLIPKAEPSQRHSDAREMQRHQEEHNGVVDNYSNRNLLSHTTTTTQAGPGASMKATEERISLDSPAAVPAAAAAASRQESQHSQHGVCNDPQIEADDTAVSHPAWNHHEGGASPSSPSNTNRDPLTHSLASAPIPATQHHLDALISSVTRFHLDALISSVTRLTDVIQQSFLKLDQSFLNLDRSIRTLAAETRRVADLLPPALEVPGVLAAVSSAFPSERTYSQPPPPPSSSDTQRTDSQHPHSQALQPTSRQTSRGILFAPPVPSYRQQSRDQRAVESQRVASSSSSSSQTTMEALTGLSTEESHRHRLEEEVARAERERERVALERRRRFQLEQKTKTLMSSLMAENGAQPGRPGLFDEDADSHHQYDLLGSQSNRNPLFEE